MDIVHGCKINLFADNVKVSWMHDIKSKSINVLQICLDQICLDKMIGQLMVITRSKIFYSCNYQFLTTNAIEYILVLTTHLLSGKFLTIDGINLLKIFSLVWSLTNRYMYIKNTRLSVLNAALSLLSDGPVLRICAEWHVS